MTTTTDTAAERTDDAAIVTPRDAPTSQVAAHPDNPRRHLGDLTELVRSMKAHGVLQPLLVLPADEHGVHLIVAGHRRHAAAVEAGLDRVPIVVRDLDRAAVIEAMLVENTSRDDLTISEPSGIASDASFGVVKELERRRCRGSRGGCPVTGRRWSWRVDLGIHDRRGV